MKEKKIPGKFELILLGQGLAQTDALERHEFSHIRTGMEDPRELGIAFDYFAPMLYPAWAGRWMGYVDMLMFQDQIYTYERYAGDIKTMKYLATLEAGYPWEDEGRAADLPSPMIEAQILECLVSGAKGVDIFCTGQFDALDMMYFARAMKQITPLEEFFLNAKRTKRVKDIASQTFVKGLQYQGDVVLLVSEYSARSRTAEVEVKTEKPVAVIDLATGQTIARLTSKKNTFEVKLEGDPLIDGQRARMFFVGAGKYDFQD